MHIGIKSRPSKGTRVVISQRLLQYQLQLIEFYMFNKVSRIFRSSPTFLTLRTSGQTSQTKLIKDSDELSPEELEELLGRPLKQSQKKPDQGIVATSTASDLSQLKPATEIQQNNKQYFYGLIPKTNVGYPQCKDPNEIVIEQTPNQNLFAALQLTKTSSFLEYGEALKKYRSQVDLYGDELPMAPIDNNSLQFKQLLHPESKYLERARKNMLVNISIPGTIENEDSRNFLQLRPVEEFRHTPLIPISDSYMQKHQEMLDRYHRKQFVFEVKTESVVNFLLVAGCVGVASYMIYLILQKEEERTVNFSRMKYQRIMGQSSETPVFRI